MKEQIERANPSTISAKVITEQLSGDAVALDFKAYEYLEKKSHNNRSLLEALEQVYARGILTASENAKNTPQQQAFHRINSFLHGGKAYQLDYDLVEEIKVPDGSKHIKIVKRAIKNHGERMERLNQSDKKKSVNESTGITGIIGRAIRNKLTTGSVFGRKKQPKGAPRQETPEQHAARIQAEIDKRWQKEQDEDEIRKGLEGRRTMSRSGLPATSRVIKTSSGRTANPQALFDKSMNDYQRDKEEDEGDAVKRAREIVKNPSHGNIPRRKKWTSI